MRMSSLFGSTLREIPTEAQITSHQLLLRAGFIRPLAAGIYAYLPLARRSMTKIENIIRSEIEAIGGQEMTMPVILPAELWKETRRWYQIGPELGRFQDRNQRDLVLAMTHEEAVADLVRREISSYKQLPRLIYHIQTKWRDDPRPRGGLIRVREFTMKDSYSLDASWEGLDKQYQAHYQAYLNIFQRVGLPVVAVKSDSGMMGGQTAHEFIYLTPIGEDTIFSCRNCQYKANHQVARFLKHPLPAEHPLPIEKVATPGVTTIDELAAYLSIPKARTAKAVFMMADIPTEEGTQQSLIFAVVRGDMEVNETKLANVIGASELRPATDDEISAIGAVAGYASPLAIQTSAHCLLVVDDLIPQSANLVAGANEPGYHLRNVNYGRDYQTEYIADITAAQQGDPCPECGQAMIAERGVEVGNIFKLGTKYSEAMKCYYQDEKGENKPIIMGSYGIGIGRLLACIAEEHHDDFGLCWPISIAPFQVHLVLLPAKGDGQEKETAEKLYQDLLVADIEVLYDDRPESPGVKFNDADLIGNPLRVTVSARALQAGGVEFKHRHLTERSIIPLDNIITYIRAEIAALQIT